MLDLFIQFDGHVNTNVEWVRVGRVFLSDLQRINHASSLYLQIYQRLFTNPRYQHIYRQLHLYIHEEDPPA